MKSVALCGIGFFILFTMGDVFPGWPIAERIPLLAFLGSMKWVSLALSGLCFYAAASRAVSPSPVYSASGLSRDRFGDPLLVLRLFAFVCVWITHSHISLKPNLDLIQSGTMQFWAIGCAHSGMTIFFTLSGYLMAKAFATGRYSANWSGIKAFYTNRILRIVPLYVVAIAVVTVLAKPDLLFVPDSWEMWGRHFFFNLYSSRHQGGPIGALWSLTTEMHFYLLVPFIFLILAGALRRRSHATVGWAAVLAAGIIFRLAASKNGADWYTHRYTPLFGNLDAFMGGFFLNGLTGHRFRLRKNPAFSAKAYLLFAVFTALALYLVASGWEYSPVMPWIFKGYWGHADAGHKYMQFLPSAVIAMTCLIIYLCELAHLAHDLSTRETMPATAWGISRVLQFGGTITYSMYVWHPPILESIGPRLAVLESVQGYIARVFLVLGGLALWSTCSYFLIERPFEKLKTFGRLKK